MTDAETLEGLAERIRAKRDAERLSLREASQASGIAFSTLGRLENGATPSLRVHEKLMAWLDGAQPIIPLPPMTLRDWFAGQFAAAAVTGMIGKQAIAPDPVAESAYEFADAMMALRARASLLRGEAHD